MSAQSSTDGIDFKDITAATPDLQSITDEYARLQGAWNTAAGASARFDAFKQWDQLRRSLQTWQSLTRLRFDQDTRDLDRKAAREQLDRMSPKLTALEIDMKRLMLANGRADLEPKIGGHAFALWESDVSTFAPEIEADLTREAQLEVQYTELIASAELSFEGRLLNLSGIEPYTQSPDRDVRYRAQAARDIVPVAAEIISRRAKRLGVAKMMFWDEILVYPAGNPKPQGDDAWIVARAREVFNAVDPSLGQFYDMMTRHELVDLTNREGKASGGYCTSFPTYGVPFIFASFNGTHGDVNVLVHEMGHAFADWQSRSKPAFDYLTPTFETAEIHSMSMEYLAAPFFEQFFGDDAERYRRQHLEDAMLFLPYGVAIDHFQHLVYANPDATPAERHRMWQQMEAKYLHWRRYGDLAYPARGALWQAKGHIYHVPFYYIDYTLALCCALQFWTKSRADYRGTVADYIELCKRGGEAAFGELVRSAKLRSPFEDDSLRRVAEQARNALASS